MTEQKTVVIVHENPAWTPTLRKALEGERFEVEEINVSKGVFSLTEPAFDRNKIFLCRLSASSHLRGHDHSPNYMLELSEQLEQSGCRVINGSQAQQLELSKARQIRALQSVGLCTPRSYVCLGCDEAVEALTSVFSTEEKAVLKPNRGGKGHGVQVFNKFSDFDANREKALQLAASPDGLYIVQSYITAQDANTRYVYRLEFIGRQFLYALRVDVSDGGVELCPAESCAREQKNDRQLFEVLAREDLPNSLSQSIDSLERMMHQLSIDICGVEALLAKDGLPYFYDINVTTNYSTEAEERAICKGRNIRRGAAQVAAFIKEICR